jgi:hypothetical protein
MEVSKAEKNTTAKAAKIFAFMECRQTELTGLTEFRKEDYEIAANRYGDLAGPSPPSLLPGNSVNPVNSV